MNDGGHSKACGEADDGSAVSFGLFAAERDALEALEPSDALLDAGAGLVKGSSEESRLVPFVGFVRNDGRDPSPSGRVAVGLAGVALVADDGARLNVGPDVEQGFEVPPVEGLAAGQIEGDDVPGSVRFGVDLGGEAAARAPKRLVFLPPFALAADTCARTMVESNIWMRCAVALIDASVSKNASKTPALLRRSKRFHTLFQWPKRSDRARQRTFSTVKK
jgi:hypothetical protein